MGHERIGLLPRTRRWEAIVSDLARLAESGGFDAAPIARRTLANVRKRYKDIHGDPGVQAAFEYLVVLSTQGLLGPAEDAPPAIDLDSNPSILQLATDMSSWIDKKAESREYAELAKRAASDAIVQWTRAQTKQGSLFGKEHEAKRVWSEAASARGFCEVARLFFAKFTERYLSYFLDREASAEFRTVSDRERFAAALRAHVEAVSNHAFETSKITQSFAAGWFNNHARDRRPSSGEIENFLAVAFGKLDEELRREGSQ